MFGLVPSERLVKNSHEFTNCFLIFYLKNLFAPLSFRRGVACLPVGRGVRLITNLFHRREGSYLSFRRGGFQPTINNKPQTKNTKQAKRPNAKLQTDFFSRIPKSFFKIHNRFVFYFYTIFFQKLFH